jgi:alpha-beta hydrolase superfamily lysophospholipase
MIIESGILKTSDNIKIAYNHFQSGHDTVLIIAHGWFMSKDSKAFKQMSEEFSSYFDVICFDFRGHSKSSGFYTFGAEETNDLSSVVNFAKKNYNKIYLLGFSLGSLISINYCAKNSDIDKLIAVSAPVLFEKIENNVFSPNAFIPTLKKFELLRWLSIRFKSPFMKKPKPIKLIRKIKCPIFLIAGEKDPIIKTWHNKKLYNVAKEPKSELIINNGRHAEDLFLEQKDIFMPACINWLNSEEICQN